jgi:histidine triad (HIT) family protein
MKDENCIFCKLANGDIPTNTVYEDGDFRAIMDASPANKGHVIILPKNHAADIFSIDPETAGKAVKVAKKIAVALKQVTGCDGVNILQNNGEAAGQTVFHYHVHVIPRFKNDTVNVNWKQGEYTEGEAAEFAKKISSAIR